MAKTGKPFCKSDHFRFEKMSPEKKFPFPSRNNTVTFWKKNSLSRCFRLVNQLLMTVSALKRFKLKQNPKTKPKAKNPARKQWSLFSVLGRIFHHFGWFISFCQVCGCALNRLRLWNKKKFFYFVLFQIAHFNQQLLLFVGCLLSTSLIGKTLHFLLFVET